MGYGVFVSSFVITTADKPVSHLKRKNQLVDSRYYLNDINRKCRAKMMENEELADEDIHNLDGDSGRAGVGNFQAQRLDAGWSTAGKAGRPAGDGKNVKLVAVTCKVFYLI